MKNHCIDSLEFARMKNGSNLFEASLFVLLNNVLLLQLLRGLIITFAHQDKDARFFAAAGRCILKINLTSLGSAT